MKCVLLLVALASVSCGSDPLVTAPSANAWIAFTNPSTATVTVLIDQTPRFLLGPRQSSLSVPVTAGVTHQIQWQVDNRAVCPTQTISLPDGANAVYPVCAF